MNIFKVQFDEEVVGSKKIPPEVKARYLDAIKNEWGYPSITNFFNMIAEGVVAHNILIIKVDPIIIDKLLKRVREKNYDSIEDWFKEQIRKELSQ
jgi:hypothetical protein